MKTSIWMKNLMRRVSFLNKKIALTGVTLAAAMLIVSQPAQAHTVSLGYENPGTPGSLTFWYGSYHYPNERPSYSTEGTMTLVGINGNPFPSTTVPYNLHVSVKPAGLVAGVTNTYCCGYSDPYMHRWQGATFTGLAVGDYRYTYNPIGRPTATWAPLGGLTSSTVTITAVDLDAPPLANAGPDQSVNEGESPVTLDGTGSNDPENDSLTYAWTQEAGTGVTLSDVTASQPTFTAPNVTIGGETLTFKLTVTANSKSDDDTVSITVVNVNHVPVADANDDQSIAEGSPVSLDGTDSYDTDSDPITYAWIQESGPTVTLTGANTATPSFTAPIGGGDGAPGVVATLVFKLTVDDNQASAEDTVTVEITNVNNPPTANTDLDQTKDENSAVSLNGTNSSDPDGDTLTYAWAQIGGTPVVLSGDTTATPSLTTPFVSAGGEDLTFDLTVNDGYGGTATDQMVVHVLNANDPPNASLAQASSACIWPPNHKHVPISILGVTDPEDNATITINSITQDEVTNGLGDGDTGVDAVINADGTALLRAERSGTGDGRVYSINFTATDLEGSDSGSVMVCVPHSKKSVAVDSGGTFDSTQ